MRPALILLASFAILSCKNAENKQKTVTLDTVTHQPGPPVIENPQIPEVSGCYIKKLGRDEYGLQLDQKGNNLTGKLAFDNYQKDDSRGTVKGMVEDKIIKLWYDFNSEGTHSVMEIYFLIEAGGLLRGTGPTEVKGDTSYFKDPASIKYDKDQFFEKMPCEGVRHLLAVRHL